VEVVASLSQGRTAAAQCGLFTHKSVPVIFEPPCILGGSVYTIKESTEALVFASKETGIEVNVDKSEYMVMSRDQNAGRSHSMEIYNSSFEMVEDFK